MTLIESIENSNVILNYVDLKESPDPKSILSKEERHCVVLKKINNEWFLYDSSYREVVNLSKHY